MTKQERLEKQKARLEEMSAHEKELKAAGFKCIAGIDEVGRGPLAGPVYTACVVLPDGFDVLGIDDSKKVTEKKRAELSAIIRERAVAYGIGIASAQEIDELNIVNATKLAMKRAVMEVGLKLAEQGAAIDLLLIDAVKLDNVDIKQESIIKGDAKCLSIAAASIVAKVARDNYMVSMDEQFPGYGFGSNKGYGTVAHYEGIREFGFTPIHRMTFLKNFEEKHSRPSGNAVSGSSSAGKITAAGNSNSPAAPEAGGTSASAVTAGGESYASVTSKGESAKVAKKYYAVKSGRKPGVYYTWDDCKAQVDGFKGAIYKGFKTIDEACEYLGINPETACAGGATGGGYGDSGAATGIDAAASGGAMPVGGAVHAYVDGSYDVATKRYSCGVVILRDDEEITMNQMYTDSASAQLRNVAGEIMGARTAIQYCLDNHIDEVVIFHDYMGISMWGNNNWKANLPMTRAYKAYVAEARKSMKIEFVKVEAHTGDKYNEMADRLAKKALGI